MEKVLTNKEKMIKNNSLDVWFCQICERQTVSKSVPTKCYYCDGTWFWHESDPAAPCNRHGEEENQYESEYFYDGEFTFEMKKVG